MRDGKSAAIALKLLKKKRLLDEIAEVKDFSIEQLQQLQNSQLSDGS